ncbi:hypothetical protein ABZ260_06380 [Streptosporangium sp. NPDC006013]|uniref:hypothetical protein n=1 Tax=Streptosporangium sp. NPDC006013 TaxID=3155596 RepID=UPI0033B09ACA
MFTDAMREHPDFILVGKPICRRPRPRPGSQDNSVRLRVIDIPTVVKRVCDTTGMAMTREEWGLYIPGIGYPPPCPAR